MHNIADSAAKASSIDCQGEPENLKEPDQICWGRLFHRTIAFESPKLGFCGSEYIQIGSLGATKTKSDRSGRALVGIELAAIDYLQSFLGAENLDFQRLVVL